MSKIPKSVRLKWPVGPHYLQWVDGRGAHAWARFKLKSTDWYLDALVIAAREAGDLDRYVGIEMALDGALSSMCAAVDAAGWGLLDSVARAANILEAGRGTLAPVGWGSVFSLARATQLTLASETPVSEALTGIGSLDPEGWLAQLRQLRDLAVQHNILVRRFNVGDKPGRFLDVPGLGPRRPVEYLRSVRKKVVKLVEILLGDIDVLPTLLESAIDGDRERPSMSPPPMTDLLQRARVLYQPDLGTTLEVNKGSFTAIPLIGGDVVELEADLDARKLRRLQRFQEGVIGRLSTSRIDRVESRLADMAISDLVDDAIERVPRIRHDGHIDLIAKVVAEALDGVTSPEQLERHHLFLRLASDLLPAHIRVLVEIGTQHKVGDSLLGAEPETGNARTQRSIGLAIPKLADVLDPLIADLIAAGLVSQAEGPTLATSETVGSEFASSAPKIRLTDYGKWVLQRIEGLSDM